MRSSKKTQAHVKTSIHTENQIHTLAIYTALWHTGCERVNQGFDHQRWQSFGGVTFGTTYHNEGISSQRSLSDIHEAWHLSRNLKLQNMNNVSWWLRIIFLDHPRKHQIRSKKKLIAPAKDVSFQYRGQTRKCSEHAPTKRFYARKIVQKLS